MLKTIQIIALLQGIFLLFILFKHRNNYKKPNLWLLLGCIISVLLHTIGDDNYNLFMHNTDWFVFHDTLIITFFFLYIKYHKSGKETFDSKDFLFFIPYLVDIFLHTLKYIGLLEEDNIFEVMIESIEIIFIFYLLVYYISPL